MITTAASQFDSRIWCKVSSPSIPGNQTSSNTHPYKRREIAFKQSSPLSTASVTKPSSRTTALSVSRMPRSSSTIRIDSHIKEALSHFHARPGNGAYATLTQQPEQPLELLPLLGF